MYNKWTSPAVNYVTVNLFPAPEDCAVHRNLHLILLNPQMKLNLFFWINKLSVIKLRLCYRHNELLSYLSAPKPTLVIHYYYHHHYRKDFYVIILCCHGDYLHDITHAVKFFLRESVSLWKSMKCFIRNIISTQFYRPNIRIFFWPASGLDPFSPPYIANP